MRDCVDQFLEEFSKRSTTNSYWNYKSDLRQFTAFLRSRRVGDWARLSEGDIIAFVQAELKRGLRPSSVRRKISVIRIFLRWMLIRGYLHRMYMLPKV